MMMVLLSSGEYRTIIWRFNEQWERVPVIQWFAGVQWYITGDGVLVNPDHVATMSGWQK